jgi:hypothetical protein
MFATPREGTSHAVPLPDLFRSQAGFNDSPEANAVLADIGPHAAKLKASGHLGISHPLNMPEEAITVQMRDGKMSITDGPFKETRDMLGTIVVIEAPDINEAVRIAGNMPHAKLGPLLVQLLEEPEALGLLALMLLHEPRATGRADAAGDLVLLEDQDRSRWNHAQIGEAQALLAQLKSQPHTSFIRI